MKSTLRRIAAILMVVAIMLPAMSFSFAAESAASIDLNTDKITIGVGQKVKTVKANTSAPLTWSSADESIATVNAKGQIKGVKKGTTTVTVSDGTDSADITVVVVKKGKGVTKITLPKTLSVTRGKTKTLKATFTPAKPKDKSIVWTSSDESVATVDSNGKVTAVAPGKATITAMASSGKTAKCTVTVTPVKVKKITLSGKTSMLRNETQTLAAKIKPAGADNQELKWTSSNKKIATVDQNGTVTAKKKGIVIITAAAKDGSGVKATFKLAVRKGTYTPAPPPAPIDPALRLGTKFVAKTCTIAGTVYDSSVLSGEYSVTFSPDNTAEMILVGKPAIGVPTWTEGTATVDGQTVPAYFVTHFTDTYTFIHTDAGFNCDFNSNITLHFVPEDAPAYPPAQ